MSSWMCVSVSVLCCVCTLNFEFEFEGDGPPLSNSDFLGSPLGRRRYRGIGFQLPMPNTSASDISPGSGTILGYCGIPPLGFLRVFQSPVSLVHQHTYFHPASSPSRCSWSHTTMKPDGDSAGRPARPVRLTEEHRNSTILVCVQATPARAAVLHATNFAEGPGTISKCENSENSIN